MRKPLHESIQVKLTIPKCVDRVLRNLGYDVAYVYQRDFLDVVRSRLEPIREVPITKGAREVLEQEIKFIDEEC